MQQNPIRSKNYPFPSKALNPGQIRDTYKSVFTMAFQFRWHGGYVCWRSGTSGQYEVTGAISAGSWRPQRSRCVQFTYSGIFTDRILMPSAQSYLRLNCFLGANIFGKNVHLSVRGKKFLGGASCVISFLSSDNA